MTYRSEREQEGMITPVEVFGASRESRFTETIPSFRTFGHLPSPRSWVHLWFPLLAVTGYPWSQSSVGLEGGRSRGRKTHIRHKLLSWLLQIIETRTVKIRVWDFCSVVLLSWSQPFRSFPENCRTDPNNAPVPRFCTDKGNSLHSGCSLGKRL